MVEFPGATDPDGCVQKMGSTEAMLFISSPRLQISGDALGRDPFLVSGSPGETTGFEAVGFPMARMCVPSC